MDRARLDLGGFDAHADNNTMDGLDGFLRLFVPPSHRFLDVLVESFHLNRNELETLEPFFVVCFRQRLRWVVREEMARRARSHKEAAWVECGCRRWTSLEGFLDGFGARGRGSGLLVLVLRVGRALHLGQLCFEFQNALLA